MTTSTKDETASGDRADIGLRESNDSDDRIKSNKHFCRRPLLIIVHYKFFEISPFPFTSFYNP